MCGSVPASLSRGGAYCMNTSNSNRFSWASSTIRTAEIILMLILLFLVAWVPYAVVTLIGQFGDEDLITPWVSALPGLFAKVGNLNVNKREEKKIISSYNLQETLAISICILLKIHRL